MDLQVWNVSDEIIVSSQSVSLSVSNNDLQLLVLMRRKMKKTKLDGGKKKVNKIRR